CGYGQNGWNAIQCKKNICKFYNDQCHEQRGGNLYSHPLDKELLTIHQCGKWEYLSQFFENKGFPSVNFRIVRFYHILGSEDQDGSKVKYKTIYMEITTTNVLYTVSCNPL